ncbi:Triosephosphate isomerase [Nosema bombycis CQ1]|uniref:Triosephosphate isomerase n=1 Tax=Nosema bombycis (strain CQ1 / CVCC 102059) TaxID=578461 RepID=R0KSD9_NOSB1|nr:Triosephosphate isomerase [Nosema bombycis CQ1]|eukprot:EOB13686.1 Triosephosphate isomerase [Nosema bombycis CQ1]
MKPFILGTWKANEGMNMLEGLTYNPDIIEVCIAPPDIYMDDVRKNSPPHLKLASQNCSKFKEGPFTGETPASLLKKKGVEYVIIGHCERRLNFNENSEVLTLKIRRGLEAGLRVILCLGENCLDIEGVNRMSILYRQFFSTVGKDVTIDIGYIPVWSIGTGIAPSPKDLEETFRNLRKWADSINVKGRILYGGSLSSQNIENYLNIKGCDGFMLGNMSLVDDFHEVLKIIQDSVTKKNKQQQY